MSIGWDQWHVACVRPRPRGAALFFVGVDAIRLGSAANNRQSFPSIPWMALAPYSTGLLGSQTIMDCSPRLFQA